MLTETHRTNRVGWCKRHLDDDWSRTIFSDETSVQLYRNTVCMWTRVDQKKYRRVPKMQPKVMIWSAFCADGTFDVVAIEGTMDADKYIDILEHHLSERAGELFAGDYRFQQDNDPKHSARKTKQWLADFTPELLQWPSASPDLNPIENL
eukprot:ANDGO_06846.mRNA.1 Transposable element Tcb2 transposase